MLPVTTIGKAGTEVRVAVQVPDAPALAVVEHGGTAEKEGKFQVPVIVAPVDEVTTTCPANVNVPVVQPLPVRPLIASAPD
jgi:hypothetical protein